MVPILDQYPKINVFSRQTKGESTYQYSITAPRHNPPHLSGSPSVPKLAAN